jgi:hypothetical protein
MALDIRFPASMTSYLQTIGQTIGDRPDRPRFSVKSAVCLPKAGRGMLPRPQVSRMVQREQQRQNVRDGVTKFVPRGENDMRILIYGINYSPELTGSANTRARWLPG